jgi:Phage tail assembly chaperone proteins, E, or 41 or 14
MNVRETVREGFVEAEPIDQKAAQPATPLPPTEPEVAVPVKEEWPIVVRLLHKEVRDNKGAMVKELSFREPTGGDITRYGNPVHVNQEGDVILNERKMTVMIAVLSGVLQPFIEGMDPRDWNSCAYRLRGFFLPEPAAW